MTLAEKALCKSLYRWRILFDESKMKYTDISDWNFWYCKKHDLLDFLEISANALLWLKKKWTIPKYKWICYLQWWKKGYYNLFDEDTVAPINDKPVLNKKIEFLIANLCNNDQLAIEWVHKTILYKYQNLNEVIIPALLFHWIQWTGKWLFMELLKNIFGEVNTQVWITQANLDSQFMPYHWKKLIVEINEIYVKDDAQGKKVMSKLKALINEATVMVEKKGVDSIPMNSIAWFIMSSNEPIPLHLDGWGNSNRRFTVIETGRYIPKPEWQKIINSFTKENISSFIARLQDTYWIIKDDDILALDNESKRLLTEANETEGNQFFQWFEDKYPHINKISNDERNILLWKYRDEIWVSNANATSNYEINKFNAWLWFKYKKVNKVLKHKKERWYEIMKEVEWPWFWEDDKFTSQFWLAQNSKDHSINCKLPDNLNK